jgi:sulfite reductase (NADPH) flavoprotein alpha-component
VLRARFIFSGVPFFKKNILVDLRRPENETLRMSTSSLIPQTAPFGDDDRLSLDRVLRVASPLQRSWLSGFLAGLDAGRSDDAAPALAIEARPSEPLTILYASESGNSERLAHDAAKAARKASFKPTVIDFADLDVTKLPTYTRLLVIAATWGEGEPPARSIQAYGALMDEGAPRLEGVTFGVLALGDTAYVEFCAIGKAIDARLEALGGRRAVDRVDCDLDFESPARQWIQSALEKIAPPRVAGNVVAVDFATRLPAEVSRDPVMAEIIEHVNLNSSRSTKQTFHVALGFDGAAPAYEPGDSLEIYPENEPALVDELLASVGLQARDSLREHLASQRDITTLSMASVQRFVEITGHGEAKRFLEDGDAKAWIEGRQLIDLFERFPLELSEDQALALTRPLPPRAYSIASSRKHLGEEAHLLVSAVRYETHGRKRSGVASTFVADRRTVGQPLRVRVKQNRHFRLPAASADIIMVGPGTGVAPFRGFVQERQAVSASGRSWLFLGDRRYTDDFLYQLEWQDALRDGSLSRIDLAFSRDTPAKIYVQDRLYEQRRDLVDWLENGASVYVCGDAKSMAKDVRNALVAAFRDVKSLDADAAEQAVAALERDRRYLQDVY